MIQIQPTIPQPLRQQQRNPIVTTIIRNQVTLILKIPKQMTVVLHHQEVEAVQVAEAQAVALHHQEVEAQAVEVEAQAVEAVQVVVQQVPEVLLHKVALLKTKTN